MSSNGELLFLLAVIVCVVIPGFAYRWVRWSIRRDTMTAMLRRFFTDVEEIEGSVFSNIGRFRGNFRGRRSRMSWRVPTRRRYSTTTGMMKFDLDCPLDGWDGRLEINVDRMPLLWGSSDMTPDAFRRRCHVDTDNRRLEQIPDMPGVLEMLRMINLQIGEFRISVGSGGVYALHSGYLDHDKMELLIAGALLVFRRVGLALGALDVGASLDALNFNRAFLPSESPDEVKKAVCQDYRNVAALKAEFSPSQEFHLMDDDEYEESLRELASQGSGIPDYLARGIDGGGTWRQTEDAYQEDIKGEDLAQGQVGICKACGEPLYFDEAVFCPRCGEGYHDRCLAGQSACRKCGQEM